MRLEDTDELMMITGYVKRSIETLKKILRDETQFKLTASFGTGTPGVDLPTELEADSEVVKDALRLWEKTQIVDRLDQLRVLGVDIPYESMIK